MIGENPRADGIRAQQLLDDEMLQHVLRGLEADAVETLATLPEAHKADHSLLLVAVTRLQATRDIKSAIEAYLTTAKQASLEPPDLA